MTQGSIS